MNILYITDVDLVPNKAPQIHVSQFLNHWQRLGCKVLLRAPRTQANMPTFKFPCTWFNRLKVRLVGDWLFQRRIYKQLKSELKVGRWDVIYTRQMTTFPALYRLCRQAGIPVVCEVNGFLLDNYATGGAPAWKMYLVKRMEAQMMRDAHLVVVPYAALKLRMVQQYPVLEDKTVIIENGVDNSIFVPKEQQQCRQQLKLDKDAYYIGFVGSFDFYHDIKTMLDAFQIIKKEMKGKSLRYLMVGDGDCRQEVQDDVHSLGIGEYVHFVGSIPHSEVVNYINAADVMVSLQPKERMKKLGEASSLKVKEYLACGSQVVLSHIAGQGSSFEGICSHVEPENVTSFAEAVIAFGQGNYMKYDGIEQGRKYSWAASSKKLLLRMQTLRA